MGVFGFPGKTQKANTARRSHVLSIIMLELWVKWHSEQSELPPSVAPGDSAAQSAC